VRALWEARSDRYSELRGTVPASGRTHAHKVVRMSLVGG
jgi:cyclic pyranopterin phosphate synthase